MPPAPSKSLVRTLTKTGHFLRTQLWVRPLLAALILAGLGWWIRGTVEEAMKAKMAGELQTVLNADVAALEVWFKSQIANAQTVAGDARVHKAIAPLLELAKQKAPDAVLLGSPHVAELRDYLKPMLDAQGYLGFMAVAPDGRVVAALRDQGIGRNVRSFAGYEPFATKALTGTPTVSRPFPSTFMLPDKRGVLRAGLPTMFVSVPVRGAKGGVVAALHLRIRPEDDFTRILSIARPGQSGDTFAFDGNGLLLSQSRFDDDLKRIGLLADREDVDSILNLQMRDPGVDMTRGRQPRQRRADQPLTRMAAEATAGTDGIDVEGYRDYRGVPVVGAWKWLPEYGIGVATEADVAEAYRPLRALRLAFWGLFGLLVASAAAAFVCMLAVSRLQQRVRKAVLQAGKLGQYTLEEKIGAGGMGVVYKARHALLRRPTAVKLLDVERTTHQAIARFEREVQLTSQLNHPNTIAIYDYGRTPEGVFYYAMEYLDGITLDALVTRFGPQPEARVVHILHQVCGSLAEAHGIGLVHRDIKPANIILNRRGGVSDVVKILDFGLVKAVDARREATLTAANSITGTPHYLPPEGIEHPDQVDARSDLYAVGAVGYFLLTGTPVFQGNSVAEVCMRQVHAAPEPPSARLGAAVAPELEAVILRCLAKKQEDRPQSSAALMDDLARCPAAGKWTRAEADAWWSQFLAQGTAAAPKAPNTPVFNQETINLQGQAQPGELS
ncbi:MAG TPA: serine/threonine protein kinase [Gemmataceae bacterium]|jgi:tRNA A-37 threonylcarbamoyl transferase component Bud32|nr:serine/threonine protein kinase [Gemmataceae bacterium]